ncbi:MAG: alpha/beta fold hydrolase [Planctomycetales bacterium]|nr:alpha/beta fold hydrolase [Planctomycetales bacterium]
MKIDIGRRALHVEQAGQGPTILLVHGFPLDHSMWRGQLTGLSDAYRVVAPDLRGFGASDPAPGDATMQALADDLALLLDALAITEPITFCGLSMGGYVGWQFFLRHRARLSRLIQCDTRAAADTPEGRQLRLKAAETTLAQGVAPLVATMMPKLFAPQTEQQQPELVEQTRQVMLATSPSE